MATYVLKLKRGSHNGKKYFGGVEYMDMYWSKTPKSAYQYTNKREAQSDARRFGGIKDIREFNVVKIS